VSVPQLPLALRYPPDQRFDRFVGAPPGGLEQLRGLATAPGDWVFLVGAAGTGKTHLCLSLCAAAEQAGQRAAYLPVAAAGGRLGDALEALQGNDVIALDGLEALAGDHPGQVALFDFHNRARATSCNVVYTARATPDALALTLPDLRSRLGQCSRITLQPLDDEGRGALLRERARGRGLVLEEPVIEWMLAHVERDPGTLTAVLDRLDRESLAAQRKVTVPFLRRVMGDSGPA